MAEVLKETNLSDQSITIGALKVIHDITGGGIDTLRNDVKSVTNSVTVLNQTTQDYWSQLSSDTQITPVEKKTLQKTFKTITSTFTAIVTSAQQQGIAETDEIKNYEDAYNALKTYLTNYLKLFDDMSATTTLPDVDTFNDKFNTYYTNELYAQNRLAQALVVYEIKPTSSLIVKDKLLTPTVSKITWNFYENGDTFNCFYKLYEDGVLTASGQGAFVDQEVDADAVKEYSCQIYSDSAYASLVDIQSVPVLFEGSSAITLALSNSNVTLSATNDGTTNDFSSTETELHVYEGSAELDYNPSLTAGSYGVSIRATYCDASFTVSSSGGIVINPITFLTADNGTRVVTVTGKTASGEDFTRTIVQTISKAKAGSQAYNYLGAYSEQPEGIKDNDYYLATAVHTLNSRKIIVDDSAVLVVNDEAILVTATESSEPGYCYIFKDDTFYKVEDRGSYLYTVALQDIIAAGLDIPTELQSWANDIKQEAVDAAVEEAVEKAVSEAVDEADENAKKINQYYGKISSESSIPSSPTYGSFFTWTGSTGSSTKTSSGQLVKGYVYLWNTLTWSELSNTDPSNYKQLMTALPDILETKQATEGYFSTVFCTLLLANSAFITQLQTKVIELQSGGVIKSKDYEKGSGNPGFEFDYDGTFDLSSGTIYGTLQVDKLHFHKKYSASETGFSDGDIWLVE